MDIVVVVLLVVLIILSVLSLAKKMNEKDIIERLGRFEVSITKELGDTKSVIDKQMIEFKEQLSTSLNKDFQLLNENVERRLLLINEKVNARLDQNFEKTNKTFMNVLERLSKIDEAQKKIDGLSQDIISLQSILTDKKSRGIFGEVNLKHILSSVFGEKNDLIYQLQYSLPNGFIADSVVFAPSPLGTIAIDSKFPLEHYQLMVDKNNTRLEKESYEKMFKMDVKKHIDAISNKYIVPSVTSDQAMMFLPAEAIFAEINAYHQDIIDYAYKKHVWLVSPTTLISTLSLIQMIIKNIERDKYTSIIHEELNCLGLEFERYRERWDKLSRSIQTVNKDVLNMSITTSKISDRFNKINQVEVGQLKEDRKEREYEEV